MPTVHSLLEIVLFVEDIARSVAFYKAVMGLPQSKDGVFVIAPGQLLLFAKHGTTARPKHLPGGVIPSCGAIGAQHVAFAVAAADFEETQSDENAPALFLTHTRYLHEHAISVPQILHHGRLDSGHHYAFVEQINGSGFDTFAASASELERHTVLTTIGAQLAKLHAIERSSPGALVDPLGKIGSPPQERALQRALLEMEATAQAQAEVTPYRQQIHDKLQSLWAQLTPRSTDHLLHGELAGNHVLVRAKDHAVYFIDIEGIHFADLESEHTFLQMIYGETDYHYLTRSGLDPARIGVLQIRYARLVGLCWFVFYGARFP